MQSESHGNPIRRREPGCPLCSPALRERGLAWSRGDVSRPRLDSKSQKTFLRGLLAYVKWSGWKRAHLPFSARKHRGGPGRAPKHGVQAGGQEWGRAEAGVTAGDLLGRHQRHQKPHHLAGPGGLSQSREGGQRSKPLTSGFASRTCVNSSIKEHKATNARKVRTKGCVSGLCRSAGPPTAYSSRAQQRPLEVLCGPRRTEATAVTLLSILRWLGSTPCCHGNPASRTVH